MKWPSVLSRIRPSRGSAHCICFCRALATHSRLKNVPQRRFEKGRQNLAHSPPNFEKTRRPHEINGSSSRNHNSDNLGQMAERRRMSTEFAAMRREELERFPESSLKAKTTMSGERKLSVIKRFPAARVSSSTGLNSRDDNVRFSRTSSSRVVVNVKAESTKPDGKRSPVRKQWSAKPTEDAILERIPSRLRAFALRASLERASPSAKTQQKGRRISPELRERSKTPPPTPRTIKSQNSDVQKPNSTAPKSPTAKLSVARPNTDSPRQSKLSKRDLYIPIISESPQIVCINKPPALLSQPGLPGEGTILDLLRYQRPDLTLQTVNRYVPSKRR